MNQQCEGYTTHGAAQGTPEWLAARLGRATGSRFSDVLAGGKGLTRKAYATQLALETITGQVAETFSSQDMAVGTEREPIARAQYEALTGNFVTEVGFCLHGSLPCGVSPDGLVDEDGGLEIKCPKASTHAGYLALAGEPSGYTAQIQGCMWITGRRWWDFVSYHPDFPANARLIVRRIARDQAFIDRLAGEIATFDLEVRAIADLILEYQNPPLP